MIDSAQMSTLSHTHKQQRKSNVQCFEFPRMKVEVEIRPTCILISAKASPSLQTNVKLAFRFQELIEIEENSIAYN